MQIFGEIPFVKLQNDTHISSDHTTGKRLKTTKAEIEKTYLFCRLREKQLVLFYDVLHDVIPSHVVVIAFQKGLY